MSSKLEEKPNVDSRPIKSYEELASPLSRSILSYINILLKIGNQRELTHEDLGPVSEQDKCVELYKKFYKNWTDELKLPHEKRSLWFVLWRTVGYMRVCNAVMLYASNAAASYGPVLILNALVRHFSGITRLSDAVLWVYVALMFVLPMLSSLFTAQSNVIMAHIGLQFRNCLINMIYRKALKLSPASRQKQSTGMIVNMFSNDTRQIQSFLFFLNNCIVAPFQIIVSLILIYFQVGPATFVGVALMLMVIPLNYYIFTSLNYYRLKKVKKTDTRVKLMNEILSGIRVIKFYAWENAFQKNILAVRQEELELLRLMAYIVAFGFTLLLQAIPVVQPVLVFYTYIKLGNDLDSATAFTTIALFNLLQFPFAFLPLGLSQYSQSLVSTKRMLNFFVSEELQDYVTHEDKGDNLAITMNQLSVCWVKESDTEEDDKDHSMKLSDIKIGEVFKKKNDTAASPPQSPVPPEESSKKVTFAAEIPAEVSTVNRSTHTLFDMTLHIPKGSLVALVGSVGSGKSSFLSAILGEMHQQGGNVNVVGSIAYCEQRPWILNATVEQNILFGEEMNIKRFDAAIHAASLEDDIKVLPGGIQTEIGERGINLSGGQKARVALARAVYKNSDVYLLDDPLSAVDAHVGQHIFKNCIKGALQGKTRILVTHQVHFLPQCDMIIILDNGRIKAAGTYDEILQSGVNISSIVPTSVSSNNLLTNSTDKNDDDDDDVDNDEVDKEKKENTNDNDNNSDSDSDSEVGYDIDEENKQNRQKEKKNDYQGINVEEVSTEKKLHLQESQEDIEEDNDDDLSADKAVHVSSSSYLPLKNEEEKKESLEDHVVSSSNHKDISNDIESGTRAADATNTTTTTATTTTTTATATSRSQKAKESNSVESKIEISKEAQDAADERHLDKREAKLVSKEEKSTGDVTWAVYNYYISAGGIGLFTLLLLALLFAQGAQIGAQFQLAVWGDLTAQKQAQGQSLSSSENLYQLETFAWISMLAIAMVMFRAVAIANHRIGTSTKLHKDVLVRIMNAPIAFFDITPLGRILNRFSSDLLVIDEELSQTISQLSNSIFQCFGAVGAVAAATKGTFLILMIPLIYFYARIQKIFRRTNTVVARLEAISRSPIYTDFSQALVGASSIRAYNDQARFIKRLEECVDHNSIAAITQQLASQWLAIRLDLLGSVISFFIALIAAATGGFLPAGFVALGLTYSFQVTTYLKFAVRMIATGEAQMNSVERMKNYAEELPQEDSENKEKLIDPASLPPHWPEHGAIEGQNVQMRYRDGPLVLKGVDFQVNGSEKVGIAGRTGSGKSSMMIALFRIQDLAEGTIKIDGVDIATIPVHTLRSKLGIIPQDPVMFSATIRFNLDPFHEHEDNEIWDILENVDMKQHILSLPKKLDEDVAEGGDNFSAGQRQLICIARALLRNPKILVLDEATASIDNETDALIQQTIRKSFQSSTVLTIAHRLHTIIDSDRIMVLDSGLLAEMDKPDVLLQQEQGLFKSLWERHQTNHHTT